MSIRATTQTRIPMIRPKRRLVVKSVKSLRSACLNCRSGPSSFGFQEGVMLKVFSTMRRCFRITGASLPRKRRSWSA
eukprot:symbB.v1.2.035893.t1/scaffold4942.1/size32600/3